MYFKCVSLVIIVGGQRDEVAEYLAAPLEFPAFESDGKSAVLEFWRRHEKKYPAISAAVLDVFSIQATSSQLERENSKAKYVKDDTRNRLGKSAVQASMCLKSWLEIKSVINGCPTVDLDQVTRFLSITESNFLFIMRLSLWLRKIWSSSILLLLLCCRVTIIRTLCFLLTSTLWIRK